METGTMIMNAGDTPISVVYANVIEERKVSDTKTDRLLRFGWINFETGTFFRKTGSGDWLCHAVQEGTDGEIVVGAGLSSGIKTFVQNVPRRN